MEQVHHQYRTRLPATTPKNDLSIWSVLKSCVGKDLSKIVMPIQFNEPLSFLERISESLEYSKLLQIETNDPIERIEAVAAFSVSGLASNLDRIGKPFNPVFGETYELVRDGYRFFSEQVSHHPPVSCFHAESDTYVFQGWIYPKLKLWGKSIEVHPKGKISLTLKKFNETYIWNNVYCSVHNIIVGKLWIEHHGTMEIICNETGLKASIQLKPAGWFHNELHRIEGFITDSNKKKLRYLYGKWTESLLSTDIASYEEFIKTHAHKLKLGEPTTGDTKKSPSVSPKPAKKILQKFNSLSIRSFSVNNEGAGSAEEDSPDKDDAMPKSDGEEIIDIPNSKILWEVIPKPDYASKYYHFTLFAMSLNEILPGTTLCPTDSRLRPDIRNLEDGELETASVEKQRIEDRQRKFLKNATEMTPRWFEKVGENVWKVKEPNYWSQPKTDIARIF